MQRNIPSSRSSIAVSRLLIAFEATEYRWLWVSSFFSSMTLVTGQLAQGWLVLRITDSPFWVGLVEVGWEKWTPKSDKLERRRCQDEAGPARKV